MVAVDAWYGFANDAFDAPPCEAPAAFIALTFLGADADVVVVVTNARKAALSTDELEAVAAWWSFDASFDAAGAVATEAAVEGDTRAVDAAAVDGAAEAATRYVCGPAPKS